MFSGCPSVRACESVRLVNTTFHEPLGGISSQLHSFDAFRDRNEMIEMIRGQKL